MTVEIVCPSCGARIPIDSPGPEPVEVPPPVARTVEVVIPATHDGIAEGPGSADSPLAGPGPDPLLDAFALGVGPISRSPEPISGAPGWPSVLDAEPATGPDLAPSVDDAPAAAGRRSSLSLVLLASYASAMTLACAWLLVQSRRHREAPPTMEPPRSAVVRDGPARTGRWQKDEGPPPIPADHRTTLGKTLKVGDLEITPLEVVRGPVRLVRETPESGRRRRDGGDDALKLRLRLRNRSADTTFAPLDETFVRDRDRGRPDSFIEDGPDDRIAPYPLAVRSEWAIVGQEFRDLHPGEAFESIVVSAADARLPAGSTPTWHIRLRTGADRDAVIGVDFRADEIQDERR
ncbi:MAG TPA: hypothetical protein VG406_09885 [Isosphaeraceae bacterium]|nr:hypothetical protein [Isosphaeraceae bacterium]